MWCSAGSDSHKFTVGCGAEPTVMSCTTQSGSSTSQNSDILSFSDGSSVNPTTILKISLLVDKPTLRGTVALPKETLGKKMLTGWHGDDDFAECTTKKHSAKFLKFAECQAKLCRVSRP